VANKRQVSVEEARKVGTTLGIDWTKVDLQQFRRGLEVELEHGTHDPETNVTNDDLTLTGKIAWAHLKEFPDYYTRLEKLEAEADALRGALLTTRATGTFQVKLTPMAPDDKAQAATFGRMSIDKQFHGDLEGASKGEMLTAGTGVKSSAGYVAIERVSGTLHGRTGTFVLQHSGTTTRGAPQLTITVVPDSGTDQLAGLAGRMAINIADGKHSYDFEYTFVAT
jgi:hypothetical protein